MTEKEGLVKDTNFEIEALCESRLKLSTFFDRSGLMKRFIKRFMEQLLQAEMDLHLGYTRNDRFCSYNARNGLSKKQIITDHGVIRINVPRDRMSTFRPILLPKRQIRFPGLDNQILSLYAQGVQASDIYLQVEMLYEGKIDTHLTRYIADCLVNDIQHWQNLPVCPNYLMVFFDHLVIQGVPMCNISNQSVYLVLGVDQSGQARTLGLWNNKRSKQSFWIEILQTLKNRGMDHMLIACSAHLPSLFDAIEIIYPGTSYRCAIIHQIRDSLKYSYYQDIVPLAADLKMVYMAMNPEDAKIGLNQLSKNWGAQYPQVIQTWSENWDHLITFLQYPTIIRKMIQTIHLDLANVN